MKGIFLVLLAAAGAALLTVLLKFGTIDPCGILRAQIRQEAAREGGFGGFVGSALPDVVVDGIIASQYGPLSPGRCIVLALQGPPPQATDAPPPVSPPAPPNTDAALKQADEETKIAKQKCKNKLTSGEFKTYMAVVDCSNP
jgi:hypothetical protein